MVVSCMTVQRRNAMFSADMWRCDPLHPPPELTVSSPMIQPAPDTTQRSDQDVVESCVNSQHDFDRPSFYQHSGRTRRDRRHYNSSTTDGHTNGWCHGRLSEGVFGSDAERRKTYVEGRGRAAPWTAAETPEVPGLHVQLRVDKMGDLSSIGVWRSIHQQFAPLTASLLQRRFMPFVNPFSDEDIESRFICVAANRRRHRRLSPHAAHAGIPVELLGPLQQLPSYIHSASSSRCD